MKINQKKSTWKSYQSRKKRAKDRSALTHFQYERILDFPHNRCWYDEVHGCMCCNWRSHLKSKVDFSKNCHHNSTSRRLSYRKQTKIKQKELKIKYQVS